MTEAGNPPPKKEMMVKRIHFTDKTSHRREEEETTPLAFCVILSLSQNLGFKFSVSKVIPSKTVACLNDRLIKMSRWTENGLTIYIF